MADIGLVDAVGAIISEIQRRTIKKKRIWTRNRIPRRNQLGASQALVKELPSDDPFCFLNLLGINMDMFDFLLKKIGRNIQKSDTVMREAIPAKVKLETACRYLATGDSMASMQHRYELPKCTISKFLPDVFDAIYEGLKEFIQIPASENDWKDIQKGFNDLLSISDCVGCIGGKHIIVKCPSNLGSQSFKGTLYIVILAMVDYEYNFTFIDIGSYGSIDDSTIFANSSLMKAIEKNQINMPEGTVILGDLALPSQLSSTKPCSEHNNLNVAQEINDSGHNHAARFIESSFDILTTRFQVLRKPINLLPETVVKLTKAVCALHNWIRKSKNKIVTANNADHEYSNSIIPESNDRAGAIPDAKLSQHNCVPETRERSSENLTTEGTVSWLVTEEKDFHKETERTEEITCQEQSLAKPSTSHPLPVLNSYQSLLPQSTIAQPPKRINSTHQIRKRKMVLPQNQRKMSKLDLTLDNAMYLLKKVALQSPFTNEFTIFGNHVASQLKTLPYAEALRLQADIQSLITSRVKHLQKTSPCARKQLTTNYSISDRRKTIPLATFFSNWSNAQK